MAIDDTDRTSKTIVRPVYRPLSQRGTRARTCPTVALIDSGLAAPRPDQHERYHSVQDDPRPQQPASHVPNRAKAREVEGNQCVVNQHGPESGGATLRPRPARPARQAQPEQRDAEASAEH